MPPRAEYLPPAISASKILCYLECPRKYAFRYVERLPPESRRVELSFGSAVHGTIGWWVEERMAGRDPPPQVLDRTFRADWFAEQQVHPSPSHRCFGCEYRSACRGVRRRQAA